MPSIVVIFLTVFLDLVGFGIVLPQLPIYSKDFGASGFMVGAIISSFSLMQLIFSPIWGHLSDRIGRRPVLLVSIGCSALSYAMFALGSAQTGNLALMILLASRAFAGICGANITVAQACIADVSSPENRSKNMGLIGMAFGFGFIFGPAIGAFSFKWLGMTGPGWVAASLCALNFLLALVILPETRKPASAHVPPRPRLQQWAHTFGTPKLGFLVVIFFLATFCFTCFETTLPLLVSHILHLDLGHDDHAKAIVGYLFAYSGIIGAFVQGGVIGRLVKAVGEPKLIAASLVLVALALGPMPFVHGYPSLLALLALLAIGSALTRPPLFGMISNLAPAHEQGATLGVTQSAGSLARIFGPVFTASLFDSSPALPYVICAGISLLTGIVAWQRLARAESVGVPGTPLAEKP
jgi:MFS transporter, DHA1 family, tetracycline resistance protein